jgi:hypothetical protein
MNLIPFFIRIRWLNGKAANLTLISNVNPGFPPADCSPLSIANRRQPHLDTITITIIGNIARNLHYRPIRKSQLFR